MEGWKDKKTKRQKSNKHILDEVQNKKMSGNRHILPEITVGEKRIISSLAGMQANIKAVKCQLSDMGKNVGVIVATSSDNAVPTSTVANPISAPIVATILATASTKITAPPRADFAAGPNPNFQSDEPALVQANKNRPRWATTVCFCLSPNQELAKNVFEYLVLKFVNVRMREADLNKYVYTTYCLSKHEQNKDKEAKKNTSDIARQHTIRTGLLLTRKWRKIALLCSSEKQCLKYNRLIKLVDEAVKTDLGSNAYQLLEQIWLRITDSAVPDAIASQLPQ
ncbi:hypothetical protein PHYBLDRAFT_173354 [Phycomyces blakesleeanus NRRL 1555(-)]|uniref:Uncharacterized protein n=1 Tax=Phycomyces blakesleeanus (strain ATCC 8743b / DSM 1359 / FGSC 10004 / NBRC 33097 / NRRL 1555) TaxID=763407 RepID=A0A167KLD1_PHYB8|nr:hypothetical protein PHYBLDRAFT_173354 [Phycomyces blakesleeanus NRRL 1555(-)]OAD68356.1 hypothetical protein PHYBLDRAFT_173354 [Phycomyces blakesleeanus NRRL 1555(-)]|eukprot:XP_018286396.1 hypothetical protein PHYBLDRAFT_173354 [Phycomyces blakesleeanus NRRL 1555(-)]